MRLVKDCNTCFNAGQVLDGPNPACHGCGDYSKWVARDFLINVSDEPITKAGVKYDNGKPQWSLLPFRALTQVVEVLTYGAKKYAPDNWKKVPDARRRYIDAGFRHLTAYTTGETNDPETGKHHLAHAICCMLYLVAFDLGEHNDKSNRDI